jgi:hypothetical protein
MRARSRNCGKKSIVAGLSTARRKSTSEVLSTIQYIEDNVIEDRQMVDFVNENAIALHG